MDRELFDSIKKSGLFLMMLLLFYAAFFVNDRKLAGSEGKERQNAVFICYEEMDRCIPDETPENMLTLPARIAAGTGALCVSAKRVSGRMVRRVMFVILLFFLISGLWKNGNRSFYGEIEELHGDSRNIYRNPVRRGPPIGITAGIEML